MIRIILTYCIVLLPALALAQNFNTKELMDIALCNDTTCINDKLIKKDYSLLKHQSYILTYLPIDTLNHTKFIIKPNTAGDLYVTYIQPNKRKAKKLLKQFQNEGFRRYHNHALTSYYKLDKSRLSLIINKKSSFTLTTGRVLIR